MNKSNFSVQNLNKWRKKYLFAIVCIVVISIIFSLVLKEIFKLDVVWAILIFGLTFFSLFLVIDSIFRNDKDDMRFNIQLLMNFLIILIFLGQLFVLSTQAGIISKQADILDRTSQSNKADLFIVSANGNVGYNLLSFEGRTEGIEIGITNLGKAIAPHVKVTCSPNSAFFCHGEKGPSINEHGLFVAWNVTSLEYKTARFRFSPAPSTNLTTGVENITFLIECPFCNEPISEQNIPICIYTESFNKVEECGDEWR